EREGNLKQIFTGQDRLGDTVTYMSPSFKGLKLAATWVLGDDAESQQNEENGYSFSAAYGDSKLKKQPFYLAAALNQKVLGIDAWRLVGQVDLGPVQLGGIFQHTEKKSAALSGEGFMVNMALPFAKNIAKLQYSYNNAKIQHPEKAQMLSLGVDHNFSKTTSVYLAATHLDLENQDDSAVSLGLRHFF
ncbi:MAG: porin, partial [Psychromonas sp.]|nr:porin [Psychromonas sp.]